MLRLLLDVQGDHACHVEASQVWLDLWHRDPLCADPHIARLHLHVLGKPAALPLTTMPVSSLKRLGFAPFLTS